MSMLCLHKYMQKPEAHEAAVIGKNSTEQNREQNSHVCTAQRVLSIIAQLFPYKSCVES